MKAKKFLFGLMVAAVPALLVTGCIKKHAPTAPVADTELQTSVDASYALFCITDAEMIGSFITANDLAPKFYLPTPASTGTVTTVQDPASLQIDFVFNNTSCMDGHLRSGTVFIDRVLDQNYNPNSNENSLYYYRYGYSGRLTLIDGYSVDGWHIVTTNSDNTSEGTPCVVNNLLTTDNYNPATTNLSWSIKGSFKLTNGDQEIFCKVDLVKTLVNTSDLNAFPASRNAIHWPVATVAYTGKVSGYTQGNVPFTMTIDDKQPILRDFTCSPDKVSGVSLSGANNMAVTQASEFHPFKDGTAYFTTGELYQREIYYGGSEAAGKGQCDNSGSIRIKGISYPVDFKK